jgi:hypothetical protein
VGVLAGQREVGIPNCEFLCGRFGVEVDMCFLGWLAGGVCVGKGGLCGVVGLYGVDAEVFGSVV